jgi:predicted dehydrogenase
VRIGLAGYGRGGRFFHAPLIGLAPECALAAVLTRSPRRRAEVHARPEDGFDDRFFLSVRHVGGVTSHLHGDWTLHGAPGPRFRVTGRTGTFAVESGDGQSERLLAGRTEMPGPFGTIPEARWGRIYRGEDVPPEPVPAQPGSWSSFYSAFARAVRGEGALPVDPRDAVAALEVLDAARVSAAHGEAVRLS